MAQLHVASQVRRVSVTSDLDLICWGMLASLKTQSLACESAEPMIENLLTCQVAQVQHCFSNAVFSKNRGILQTPKIARLFSFRLWARLCGMLIYGLGISIICIWTYIYVYRQQLYTYIQSARYVPCGQMMVCKWEYACLYSPIEFVNCSCELVLKLYATLYQSKTRKYKLLETASAKQSCSAICSVFVWHKKTACYPSWIMDHGMVQDTQIGNEFLCSPRGCRTGRLWIQAYI